MAINLPTFPEFDLQPRETVPTRFEKYHKRLNNLFAAMGIEEAPRKKAMLLHYVGEDVCDIFDTLTVPAPEPDTNGDVYKSAVKAISDHFEPQKCVDHHVYNFRKEAQRPNEKTSEFYTRLQLLARKCEFTDVNLEIKRQLIQTTTSARIRRKAIEQGLNLDQILKYARAMEMADDQAAEIETEQSNAIRHRSVTKTHYPKPQSETDHSSKCGLCGGSYPHKYQCPAKGKRCLVCDKLNHFAKMCRNRSAPTKTQVPKKGYRQTKQRARAVTTGKITSRNDESDDSEEQYTYHVSSVSNSPVISDEPMFDVTIGNTSICVMADSGATVNIINEQDYLKMKPRTVLLSCTTRLYPYMSSKPLELCGKFQSDVTNKQDTCSGTFYVAKGPSRSLLSWKTSQRLKLIQVTNAVEETEIPEILKEFSELASGIGEYKGAPVKIHIDESVKPVAQPHRRIPFHVRKQVEEKLDQLMEDDIIERAEGPTSWISPIVVVPKPNNSNEIRICVDMRALNRAIIRERHVIPTTDDIIADLNGCKVFSKIDLNQGYHQFPLHEDSRNLTTFSTHVGLYRYKRLNFGLSCAAEIFQRKVGDAIAGIQGVRNISDDIYVGGVDKAQHDERLVQVLSRLKENQLTVNVPKCLIGVPSMLFFGHIFSGEGVSPDPKKVEAMQSANAPSNPSEVRSLLSSAAFCSRFIRNFATTTRLLRRLTCNGVPWEWGKSEQHSFEKLKAALSAKTTLAYFDPKKPTTIFVDASPIGLGAVLTQENADTKEVTPLYFASRPLTPTES